MRWASTVTTEPRLEAAVGHAAHRICEELDRVPDLALVFFSPHYTAQARDLADCLGEEFGGGALLGCSAGGVIGGGREIEAAPGLSITAAALPGVELVARHFAAEELPELHAGRRAWTAAVGLAPERAAGFLLLADPFSFPVETFLRGMDRFYPGRPKLGGLASGGREAGGNLLLVGDRLYDHGVVCVGLAGEIELQTLVAQGCRPIGEPMFVTRAHDNLLIELDGCRPVQVLEALYAALGTHDRTLFRHSLSLGIVMQPARSEYRQGDFLIRNLLGSDPDSGALWIGAELQAQQVVQFHLRDADTSARDLELVLARLDNAPPPSGSLLFSCLGRGQHLYGEPDHDSRAFQRHVGDVPLGGFFCAGEIGPVQGRTYLHGYTSAFGVFRRLQRS